MKFSGLLLGSLLVVVPLLAEAQQYAPPTQRPATPPSWSYDPYTSGLGPCPQKSPWDTQTCSQMMPPTYGQPSYWSK